jgi:hypothetical protein
LFIRETTADNSKSSNPTLDQQSSLSSIEEKSLASRCSISSSNDNKSPIKERQSTDSLSTNIKTITIKKPTITKPK